MKPNRNSWYWLIVEIIMAVAVQWVLLEMSRGFSHTRAWLARLKSRRRGWAGGAPAAPDLQTDFSRN